MRLHMSVHSSSFDLKSLQASASFEALIQKTHPIIAAHEIALGLKNWKILFQHCSGNLLHSFLAKPLNLETERFKSSFYRKKFGSMKITPD